MKWNDHYRLRGQHAVFSPSTPTWLRYDEDKVKTFLEANEARLLGTQLHDYACQSIKLSRLQPKDKTDSVSLYVNDAIRYGMTPEQCLYFSQCCFGHADAIGFDRGKLRIFDLKTGTVPGKMEQLMIYDALFCHEYNFDPRSIEHDLRIYQYGEVKEVSPDPEQIIDIMDQIVRVDEIKTAREEMRYE